MILSYQHVSPSWTEQRRSPWERIYILEILQKNTFKNLNDFDSKSEKLQK